MNKTQILPSVLIFIDLCAGCVYFVHGEWKRGLYWIAAAVLTATVTF